MRVEAGNRKYNLTQKDFVAEGGEGKIYASGDLGFKIYKKSPVPILKIQELQAISKPNIIIPKAPVTSKGKHVGFTFRFVRDTYNLCQLFPRNFRDRQGLTHEMVKDLVTELREGIEHVHQQQVLLVDGNEMNFLVSQDFKELFFIDTDSYQTPHFQATAIMPSIRDWHSPNFTELSDWFSFGIVSFQMFTGIHPFRGKHPSVKGFEARMKAGISVFNPDVQVPRSMYPLSVIPTSYHDWYKAVFEDGKRIPPPQAFVGTIIVKPVIQTFAAAKKLNVTKLFSFEQEVKVFTTSVNQTVALTQDYAFVGQSNRIPKKSNRVEVFFDSDTNTPLLAWSESNFLVIQDTSNKEIYKPGIHVNNLMVYEGALYAKNKGRVLRIQTKKLSDRLFITSEVATDVIEHASSLWPGVVIQSLLGEPYACILHNHQVRHIALPQIKGTKLIEAKYDHPVLMLRVSEKGNHKRLVYRFDKDFEYDLREVGTPTPAGLNFVSLFPHGPCVCLNEDEKLEIFSGRKGSQRINLIEDPTLRGDIQIGKYQGGIVFVRGRSVYRAQTK